jgi:hypothetical protein
MTTVEKDFTTDVDGWGYLTGAQFVGPHKWLAGLPQQWTQLELHMNAYIEGLATAAADDGTLLDFRANEWYEGPLSDAMRDEYDEPTWKLKYDRFAAMVLMDIEHRLLDTGYLATRGNGDSVDRRLTLPSGQMREDKPGITS